MSHKKQINIYEIVPPEHYLIPDTELAKKYTEWCLTKYIINGILYVTISIQHPNNKKLYVDNTGEIIIYNIDEKYDKFITEKIYWYAE